MDETVRLGDRYRLLRSIGSGSEGRVFLAIQESTHRILAVKEISKDAKCYCREGVEVWKRLHHAHLPEVIDLMETEDTIWIVMEYIEGVNLTAWIREHGVPHNALLFQWLWVICDTMEYLHGQEPPVIFGDLKPENIMIQKEMPILVDLGSAFVKGSRTKRTGTYAITDPEADQDRKHDIFCLGKTLEYILPQKGTAFTQFAKKATEQGKKGFMQVRDCKRFLRKILFHELMKIGLLFLGAFSLILCIGEMKEEEIEGKVMNLFQEYEEMTEEMLSDLKLSEEEYCAFLSMWGKVEADGQKREDLLKKNLTEYASLCYKMGVFCWYFADQWDGIPESEKWFQKLQVLPQSLQKNSSTYLQLAGWKKQVNLYAKTTETDGFFTRYYQELEASGEQEEPYFSYVACKEKLLFAIHYMSELKAEGVNKVALDELKREAEQMTEDETDQREQISLLRNEVKELIPVLKETIKRIYNEEEL